MATIGFCERVCLDVCKLKALILSICSLFMHF